jgi:hypothetical protein
MKSITLFFALFCGVCLWAQVPRFDVYEASRDFGGESRNALIIELPGVAERDADKVWQAYIKENGGRLRRAKDIKGSVANDIAVHSVAGHQKFNLYSRFESTKTKTTLLTWFELPGGFLRSEQDAMAYRGASEFLQNYGINVRASEVEDELKEEEKNLRNLERDLDKLKRDNANLHKEIESAKDRIAKAEKDIQQNLKDQGQAEEQIKSQQEKLRAVREKLGQLKK